MMDLVWMALVQIIYVSLNALRVTLMIKGKKAVSVLISMVEIGVYIVGLAIVLRNLDSAYGIVIYSVSYGIGVGIGMLVEQKIAIGYVILQVITENERAMAEKLRQQGFGVTSWPGQGAQGVRMVHMILAKRKEYDDLQAAIREIDAKAFIVSMEPTRFVGGFWTKKIR